MDLAGRNVVVVGLGASGRAAARACLARGARVTGVDRREDLPDLQGIAGLRTELGPHRRQTFLAADLIVVSPGVPPTQPDLASAEAAGVPVMGELGLGVTLLGQVPVVAVTGTNGKSTVTSFCGQLLRAAGLRCFVGGNLGDPLCRAVVDPAQPPEIDVAVLECSSYQLERPGPLRARAAAYLNLTPDHLARHGTMQAYAAAKARILERQLPSDLALIAQDPLVAAASRDIGQATRGRIGALPGVVVDGDRASVQIGAIQAELDLGGLPVPGAHNRLNAAVAAALALWVGAPVQAVQAGISSLRALPHRMQVVADRGDVTWINDSKATNVEAAAVGIEGLARPAVVLLGGEAKGPGFSALAPALARHRAVVTFGGSGTAIADELTAAGVAVHRAGPLDEAVRRAASLALPGDAVLLSPGCASFDAFDNFEHRGAVFAALVQEVSP